MKNKIVKIGKIGITKRGRKRIYWTETKNGEKKQRQFRWGSLRTKKLKQIVNLYNAGWDGSLRARKGLERRYHVPHGSFQYARPDSDIEQRTKIDPFKDSDHVFSYVLAEIKKLKNEFAAEKADKINRCSNDPLRKEIQSAHARHLFADFVSRASGLTVLFKKLDKEEPMESWAVDKLDFFLDSVAAIREASQRIEKILQNKLKP